MRWFVLILLVLLATCGVPAETREARAIRALQSALPASTREAQGLPFGGWSARMSTSWMTVTLPLNTDADIERGLRSNRALLVKGVAQLFTADRELEHMTIVGTLPSGPDKTDIPALVGDIGRADVAAWDGSDQLGLWKMSMPK